MEGKSDGLDENVYKIVILGGGPAGYAAALEGIRLGQEVVLIEEAKVGGTCLHHGCIPTKSLFHQSKNKSIDYHEVWENKCRTVEKLTEGMLFQLNHPKLQLINGRARFINEHQVEAKRNEIVGGTDIIDGDIFIIATGSVPSRGFLEAMKVEGIMTSEELLDLQELPKDMIIIGAGVVGVEFASIMNAFGVSVCLIESMPTILPAMEGSLAKRLESYMKKDHIEILTGAKVEQIEQDQVGYRVILSGKKGKEERRASKVLNATGRRANTRDLGLEKTGVKVDKKGILCDHNGRTDVAHIYAIGDVTGNYMLAHVATWTGKQVLQHIVKGEEIPDFVVPQCVFSTPEVASVGITEAIAKEKGIALRVGKAMFSSIGMAQVIGETEGYMKVLVDEQNVLVGVHIIGPRASELIQEASLMVQQQMSTRQILATIHAHPSLGEIFIEAIEKLE